MGIVSTYLPHARWVQKILKRAQTWRRKAVKERFENGVVRLLKILFLEPPRFTPSTLSLGLVNATKDAF
jgi:hypothetical protein